MGHSRQMHEAEMRWIAWDGLQFPVPVDWDLAGHDTHRGIGSLRLDDAGEVRLQLDWAWHADRGACTSIRRQHDALSARMTRLEAAAHRLSVTPHGWAVCVYRLSDGTGLLTALHVGAQWPVSVFLRLHAAGDADYPLERVARRLLDDFSYQAEGVVLWAVFDMALLVSRRFRLVSSSFMAGRKLLQFECRHRRLWIWRFSLADRMLSAGSPVAALAAHFNASRDLPGVRFVTTPDEQVVAQRRRGHPFGHAVEIGRWCFSYHCRYWHDPTRNALLVALFHYRNPDDLRWLDDLELDARLTDSARMTTPHSPGESDA